MELIERINLQRTHYLKTFSFKDFQTYLNETEKKSLDEKKKLFEKLKSYCDTTIKTRGETKRIYSYSLSTPIEVGGRLFCGNSIQGLPKIFRGFLMGDTTTDIDMKNAHPTILEWLCNKHNIICSNLSYYNNHRDEILMGFDNAEEAKKMFLKSVNDDKLNKKEKNAFFKDFDKEMKTIQIQLLNRPEYEYIKQSVPEHKLYNFYGSAINRLLCVYENKILQSVISVVNKNNIEIASLMFDGLMIYGNKYADNELLTQIEDVVANDFEGLNMKFAYKQHNQSIQLPEDFCIPEKIKENNELRFANNDDEASDILFNELKDNFKSYKGRLFYLNGYIWIDDINKINDIILRHILQSKIYSGVNDKTDKPISYAQNVSKANKIRDALYAKIRVENDDPNLYEKFHTTTGGEINNKLCFNDGVLDFKECTFTKWEDIPKNTIYSTMKINYDLGSIENIQNKTYMNEVKTKLLEPMFNDKMNVALHFLSRAIAGNYHDKRWATYMGNRNCGKGVLYDALKNAFGDYVNEFELGNLTYNRKTAGMENVDCSKKLYWLMDLEFVRLAISQEVPDKSSGLVVNSKLLKRITGGGDPIVARRNYDRQDTHFKTDLTPFILGNGDLQCDAMDCDETRLEFSSVIQFKTPEEIELMKEEGRSELEMKRYRVRDAKIKSYTTTDEWKYAIIGILLEAYSDEAVPIIREIDAEENSLLGRIEDIFQLTQNTKDLILTKDVYAKLDEYDKKKIKTELNAMNIFDKRIKDRDSVYRDKVCFVGIKLKAIPIATAVSECKTDEYIIH